MSKAVNKTLVGTFVTGAAVLLCMAVAIFGSGQFFKNTSKYVLIFSSSINGLRKGSPVVFRGVPVGQVSHIAITGDVDDMDFQTPVVIELDQDLSEMPLDPNASKEEVIDSYMLKLINAGLRARLTPQSMLTGQLMVELDFFPRYETGKPIDKITYYTGLPEIPTLPSRMDTILQTFYKLPLEEIAFNVLDITEGLKIALGQANVDELAKNASDLVQQLKTTADNMGGVMKDMHTLAESYKHLADNANVGLTTGFATLQKTLVTIDTTISNINTAVTGVRGILSPSSLVMVELTRSLREMSEAARAVRGLANTLDRNPEALLRGKGGR